MILAQNKVLLKSYNRRPAELCFRCSALNIKRFFEIGSDFKMKSSDIQCVLVVITIAGLVIEARKLLDRNRMGLPIPDRRIGEILDIVDFRRKWNVRPMIEMGPGVVKTEPSKFPENQLAKDLKKLIYLKKKRDSSKVKDFNGDKEFLNRK